MALVTLAIGGIALYETETRLVATTGDTLALAAADIADKLDLLLFERYADMQILAQAPVFQGHDQDAINRYLTSFKRIYSVYQWFVLTDRNGRTLTATDVQAFGQDNSGQNWFVQVRDRGGVHMQDEQASDETAKAVAVSLAAPVLGPHGEFLGVVRTGVSLPALEDIFMRTVRDLHAQQGYGSTIEYQFLTRDGEVIVDSLLKQEGRLNLKYLGLPSALLTASAQPGYVEETHPRRHVPVVTGYAQTEGHERFSGLHWGILVRMDRADILAPIRVVLWKMGLAGTAVVVPSLGFLLWTTGRLRREWLQAQEECARATAAEATLRESEERFRAVAQQVISAQEEERRRIARELHDETGQSLTALLVGLRLVENARSMQEAQSQAKALRRIAASTLDEVWRLAWGLRPSVLDDLGLVATLERYANDYSTTHGIRVDVQTSGLPSDRLPLQVETTLYRIMQEALTNTAKHAKARTVGITVEYHAPYVQMVVKDDGCGFDVGTTLPSSGTSKRLGLHGMQERAALLNGSIVIESKPGIGTTIHVRIPIVEGTHGEN